MDEDRNFKQKEELLKKMTPSCEQPQDPKGKVSQSRKYNLTNLCNYTHFFFLQKFDHIPDYKISPQNSRNQYHISLFINTKNKLAISSRVLGALTLKCTIKYLTW